MTALGIVLVSLVAYFGIGFLLAVRDMPNLWLRARKAWYSETNQRGAVNAGTACTYEISDGVAC